MARPLGSKATLASVARNRYRSDLEEIIANEDSSILCYKIVAIASSHLSMRVVWRFYCRFGAVEKHDATILIGYNHVIDIERKGNKACQPK